MSNSCEFYYDDVSVTSFVNDKYGAATASVVQLCQKELNVSPEIISSQHLGKVIPGKVQPLVVTVRSEEQATTVISTAKALRQSLDPTVRDHVYFNPDLTHAQANAAYQARCQRRQLQAARNNRSSNTSALPLSSHSDSNSVSQPLRGVLQSSAAEFIPSATSATT